MSIDWRLAVSQLQLFYDLNDLPIERRLKDERIDWLMEIGAVELGAAGEDAAGFLFSYQHADPQILNQVGDHPGIRDRPEDRHGLVNLDDVLQALQASGITLPTPKTWILEIDAALPADLEFPLFLRTRKSSWKRGGDAAKVRNVRELTDECELLRRAFGWDTTIIARRWLNIASAGRWMFGDAPQEIRTWVVDGEPAAWSFHYLHAVPDPAGFPPSPEELSLLRQMAALATRPFRSRLVVADFVRDTSGHWHFIEAGPGAAAGTGHESVFKWVAQRLVGKDAGLIGNAVGGQL